MMLVPVRSIAHRDPTIAGGIFAIGAGLSSLFYFWFRFFRAKDGESKAPLLNMIGISLICCMMVGVGILEWLRALRISR